jgi:hypothetical protein
MALTLKNNGFNTIIIHETKDYQGVGEWLGQEYMELPHQEIESQNLELSPEDFVVIPEIYGHVMEQIKNFLVVKLYYVKRMIICWKLWPPGVNWSQHGFYKCITTSESQKKILSDIMKTLV